MYNVQCSIYVHTQSFISIIYKQMNGSFSLIRIKIFCLSFQKKASFWEWRVCQLTLLHRDVVLLKIKHIRLTRDTSNLGRRTMKGKKQTQKT